MKFERPLNLALGNSWFKDLFLVKICVYMLVTNSTATTCVAVLVVES